MQMREPVEKQHGEANDYRNDAEPDEDERPFILSRRRSGNPEHQRESTENVSQKFDHNGTSALQSLERHPYGPMLIEEPRMGSNSC
jgi:hypothetical protein